MILGFSDFMVSGGYRGRRLLITFAKNGSITMGMSMEHGLFRYDHTVSTVDFGGTESHEPGLEVPLIRFQIPVDKY